MYCGQCGKKVMDSMLFCPFCGSPIVIPDQDEPAASVMEAAEPASAKAAEAAAETASPAPELAQERPVSLFDTDLPAAEPAPAPEEEFVPLRFDYDAAEDEEEPESEERTEAVLDVPEEAPVRPVRSAQTRRPESTRKRPANTYIPVKDIAPDDIFMGGTDADEDEYDLDADDYDGGFGDGDDYRYEDEDEGGFFHRHIRGFVGLILFVVLLAVCALWANTDRGQTTLARFNIAWRAEPYAELGYQAYLEDNDLMAARYYEKAFSRDEGNYEYAHSAMVAYYEAEDIPASAAMLKRCIAMEPDNPEPYLEMLILYPDAATRPWEIRELVSDGYRRTGDPGLKQD